MRILIIEDDGPTAQTMELLFKSVGFNAYVTDLGEEGVDLAKIYDFDLITLDLGLPDINGLEVLRQIRVAGVKTPIMIVSGTSNIETKVKTFGGGADDYLEKPFHRDELLARSQAIIRRSKGHAAQLITVGPIALDLDGKTVSVGGKPAHLTGKEYQMLELLMLRKGTTLTKDAFLNHLYGGMDEPELKIIDVFICKLRKKLSDAAGGVNHIETVWGRGYRMVDEPVTKQAALQSNANRHTFADKLATARGRVLIYLAGQTVPRKAGTIELKCDVSASNLYQILSIATREGLIDKMGGYHDRQYSITESGLVWLRKHGWTAPAEAAAA